MLYEYMDNGPVNVFLFTALDQITALGVSMWSAPHGRAFNVVLNLNHLTAPNRSLSCGRLAPDTNLEGRGHI
jgi:lipoate-protein ligase B